MVYINKFFKFNLCSYNIFKIKNILIININSLFSKLIGIRPGLLFLKMDWIRSNESGLGFSSLVHQIFILGQLIQFLCTPLLLFTFSIFTFGLLYRFHSRNARKSGNPSFTTMHTKFLSSVGKSAHM